MYGHGLEQDLSHLRDMSDDSDITVKGSGGGMGTVRSRALSF
jgi:hypothetical protein